MQSSPSAVIGLPPRSGDVKPVGLALVCVWFEEDNEGTEPDV